MRKRVVIIASIIALVLAISLSSVYAIWYITTNRLIDPANVTEDVVKSYLEAESREYNGSYQLPISNRLDNSKLTYYYKDDTDGYVKVDNINNLDSEGYIDSGIYDVQVSFVKETKDEAGNSHEEIIYISDIEFIITPKELDVTQITETSSLVYNATSQTPNYDISSLLYDRDKDKVDIVASSIDTIDAGIHKATINLIGDNASNYILSSNTISFGIAKKPISIDYWYCDGTNFNELGSLVYSATQKTITCSSDDIIVGDSVTFSYSYQRKQYNETSYMNVQSCFYAGDYNITANISGGADANNYKLEDNYTTSLSIDRVTLTMSNQTFSYSYSSNNRTWSALSSLLSTDISGLSINGLLSNDIGLVEFTLNGMNDGTFGYGNDASTYNKYTNGYYMGLNSTYLSTYVVGSTYLLDVFLLFNSDALKNSYDDQTSLATITLKYRTVKIGSSYYTIEDAIATSGNIITEGNLSNTEFVATTFSKILDATTYDLTNRSLLVPYQSTSDVSNYYDTSTTTKSSGYVYSALIIPGGITLEVSSGNLGVGAQIRYAGGEKLTIVCDRGVVYNSGTINISSSNLYSYGYIKGDGLITMTDGSSAIDCLATYDWIGGSAAIGLYNDVLLTNAWTMHNISCPIDIDAGCTYSGFVFTYLSEAGFTAGASATATILGSSSSSNCIFKITGGHLSKSTIKADGWDDSNSNALALYSITGSNQIAGQRDVFELCGTFEDSTLSIDLSVKLGPLSLPVSLKTSTSKPATVGFMDIYVREGSTLTLSNSDYAFLPGSTVEIDKRATVTVNNGVDITVFNDFANYPDLNNNTSRGSFYKYCIDKVDAEFVVNGTLNVNGSIGGYVNTSSEGAQVIMSSSAGTSSSYVILNNSDAYSSTLASSANINGSVTSFANGNVYISVSDGSDVYWQTADNVNQFTINFYDDNNLLQTITVYSVDDTTYTVTGDEFIPTRDYYDFVYWSNADGSQFTGITLNNGESIDLYANWEETEYNINYIVVTVDGDGDMVENVTDKATITSPSSFTISDFVDGIIALPSAIYEQYYFDGWYLGYDKTSGLLLSSITIELLDKIINNYDATNIPLYCEFSKNPTYTIEFDVNNSSISGDVSLDYVQTRTSTFDTSTLDSSYYTWSQSYDNDSTFSKYFGQTSGVWCYKDSNGNLIELTNNTLLSEIANSSNVIVLYAKWNDKLRLTYDYSKDTYSSTKVDYHMPGSIVSLAGYNLDSTAKVYQEVYGNVDENNNNTIEGTYNIDGTFYQAGSSYSYNGQTYNVGDSITINENMTLSLNYVTFTCSTVTIYSVTFTKNPIGNAGDVSEKIAYTLTVKNGYTINTTKIINGDDNKQCGTSKENITEGWLVKLTYGYNILNRQDTYKIDSNMTLYYGTQGNTYNSNS